jgi:hypothetical protein
MMLSLAQAIQCQLLGWLLKGELVESGYGPKKVLYWHLVGGAEENHKNFRNDSWLPGLDLNLRCSEYVGYPLGHEIL